MKIPGELLSIIFVDINGFQLAINIVMKRLFKCSLIVILLSGTAVYLPSCMKEATPPEVMTAIVSDITQTSASIGGTVTDDGEAFITARGRCWDTSENPTTTNDKRFDGANTVSYSRSLALLIPDTKYCVRAFATNSAGTA